MSSVPKVICPNCKLENKKGGTRCTGCGNSLPRFAGLPKVAEQSLPPPGDDNTPGTTTTSHLRGTDETQQVDATDARKLLAAPPQQVPEPEVLGPAANAVGWLHCDPLPPMALIPGREITIGRKNCRLILPHTEVSRHHATIKVVSATEITIADQGSSNGTYVNGKRTTGPSPLRVGDLIRIGPYSIEVWQVKDLPVEDPDMTRSIPLAAEPTFAGKLGAMSITEVVDQIASRKRSGVLSVTDRQQRGQIRFEEGNIVLAEWGAHRGDAAVQEMAKLAFGSFAFEG